jgi:hypothetical protein
MRLAKAEKEVILECLKSIFDCGYDQPFYQDEFDKEVIRRNLIKKFTKELNKDE